MGREENKRNREWYKRRKEEGKKGEKKEVINSFFQIYI